MLFCLYSPPILNVMNSLHFIIFFIQILFSLTLLMSSFCWKWQFPHIQLFLCLLYQKITWNKLLVCKKAIWRREFLITPFYFCSFSFGHFFCLKCKHSNISTGIKFGQRVHIKGLMISFDSGPKEKFEANPTQRSS